MIKGKAPSAQSIPSMTVRQIVLWQAKYDSGAQRLRSKTVSQPREPSIAELHHPPVHPRQHRKVNASNKLVRKLGRTCPRRASPGLQMSEATQHLAIWLDRQNARRDCKPHSSQQGIQASGSTPLHWYLPGPQTSLEHRVLWQSSRVPSHGTSQSSAHTSRPRSMN